MLLRLLCCDDDGWREWGPVPALARFVASWRYWTDPGARTIRQRRVAVNDCAPQPFSPPIATAAAVAAVHRNPAFDRCVCLTPPRAYMARTHTHTRTSHQRPTPPPLRSVRLRRRRRCSPHLFNNNNIQLKYYMPPPVSPPVVEPLPVGHRSHKPTRTHNIRFSQHTHRPLTKPPCPQ